MGLERYIPDKKYRRIAASKPFPLFSPFHGLTQNSNGNEKKRKNTVGSCWGNQSFQIMLTKVSRSAEQRLRNWLATGELLIVLVFNLGGILSPLIKRETKEPNSLSGRIYEMKCNSDRHGLWSEKEK